MFGIESENAHIINGHVPIHHMEGESPIKCNGKVIIIDGGFSQPYHKVTGIAGYTLIYNSYGLMLTAHEPFKSVDDTIRNGIDMQTNRVASEVNLVLSKLALFTYSKTGICQVDVSKSSYTWNLLYYLIINHQL